MTYISLYRRCRPLRFSDMTGQEHITRTLSNALSTGQLGHAYLFSGPRGTGKTTAAKILARAMNCEQFPVAEPCGKCIPCQNIGAGVSIDVIEMDAASNRGIDEIRDLRERSRFASGESRYKVYIIDEAHMLTTEACNAFLKTLEEPPRNVVFILATTDPSRLLSTIVSRCQRFDFHLLTTEQIAERLKQIISEEGWQVEAAAVNLIGRLADGSLRDGLGILEQCAAYGADEITAEHVRIVTGATRADTLGDFVKAAIDNDLDSGLKVLEQVVYTGRDIHLFMRDLIFVFSRFLLKGSLEESSKVSGHFGFEELITAYRGRIERERLLDAIELLHEVEGDLRNAHFPQYVLEVAFIRLLRLLHGRLKPVRQGELPETGINEERNIVEKSEPEENQAPHRESEIVEQPGEKTVVKEEIPNLQKTKSSEVPTGAEITDKLTGNWPKLIEAIKNRQKSTAAWLEPASVIDCRGELVILGYSKEYSIHQIRIMEESHRGIVEEVLSYFCRKELRIKAEVVDIESLPKNDTISKEDTGRASRPDSEQNKKQTIKKAPSAEDAMELFGGKLID